MGVYNNLETKIICPECGSEPESEIQFYLGELLLDDYVLGDKIKWNMKHIPQNGNYIGIGYGECINCGFEFWADIIVQNHIITVVVARQDEPDYSATKLPKYE